MGIKDALLPEFDHEMATTRRLLERVPDAEFGWKPHDKSMTLGRLAAHIANLPYWMSMTLETTVFELDSLPPDTARDAAPSRRRLLKDFEPRSAPRAAGSPPRSTRSCSPRGRSRRAARRCSRCRGSARCAAS